MSNFRPCKCRLCLQTLDRNTETWQAYSNGYAHVKCLKLRDDIHNVCKVYLRESYSKAKIDAQIKSFVQSNMNLEGIYKAIYWWYAVKNSDPNQANGGIGIVPHIYEEAELYFKRQENNKHRYDGINFSNYIEDGQKKIKINNPTVVRPKRLNLFELK